MSRKVSSKTIKSYQAAITDLQATLADGAFHNISAAEFATAHGIGTICLKVLVDMRCIEREQFTIEGTNNIAFRYKRLAALAKLRPEVMAEGIKNYKSKQREELEKKKKSLQEESSTSNEIAPPAPSVEPEEAVEEVSKPELYGFSVGSSFRAIGGYDETIAEADKAAKRSGGEGVIIFKAIGLIEVKTKLTLTADK